MEKPEVDAACLAVIEKALAMDHDACRESALHGLGHAKWYYPAEVQRIIGDFLKAGKNISPDLWKYAEAAGTGIIQVVRRGRKNMKAPFPKRSKPPSPTRHAFVALMPYHISMPCGCPITFMAICCAMQYNY